MKVNELTNEVTLTQEEYNELTKKKETPGNMLPYIVWNGDNIQEVLNFTGVDSRFDEWFKSFEDYENYVHSHSDIFKIFINNSKKHYECPVGTIIVKTEAGYNYPLGILLNDNGQVESSELEEASDDYATRLVNKYTKFGMMDVAAFDGYWLKDAFKDGAKFQKHLMLKDAISTIMQRDDLDDLVPTLDDQKEYKVGDKVKVLIFKDDE